MKTDRGAFWLGAMIVCCLLSAITSGDIEAKRAVIDPAPALSKSGQCIFDLSIYRADIRGYRMVEALDKLSQAVKTASNDQLRFVFQISWLKPQEYMRKYGGLAAWPLPDQLNPFVHYEGVNIDLRTIIKAFCRQSGWTYDETVTPVGYVFTVREKPRRRPNAKSNGTARAGEQHIKRGSEGKEGG
jgi:hypothetical protein